MSDRLSDWLEEKKTTAIGFIDPGLETCSRIAGGNSWVADAFTVPGLSCQVLSMPSHEAQRGGDIHYVSVCGLRMKSKFLLIDTVGHGEFAAELSSALLGVLGPLAGKPSNQEVLAALNDVIRSRGSAAAFATAAAATFNNDEGTWTYAYAGHPNMLLQTGGEWVELEADGGNSFPVGTVCDTQYYQTSATLKPGDWILMYSDGILDVATRHGNGYTPAALADVAASIKARNSHEFFPKFVERLVEINQSPDFDDDATLILIDCS